MLLAGSLAAVSDLTTKCVDDFERVQWIPPPTYDLTDIEPDIMYIIDVFRSDGVHVKNYSTLYVTFNISLMEFNNSCLHFFTITPRSNIKGAVLGTRSDRVPIICTIRK